MLATLPPNKVLKFKLPPGKDGVRETLKAMRHFVIAGKNHPAIRDFAAALVSDLPQKDFAGEIREVFFFARDGIRYIHDATDTEILHTADYLLARRCGDCDDKVILLCALLESIGKETRLHAVGFDPGQLSHVYCDVKFHGRWEALDPTEPVPPGWYPPDAVEHMILENRECA